MYSSKETGIHKQGRYLGLWWIQRSSFDGTNICSMLWNVKETIVLETNYNSGWHMDCLQQYGVQMVFVPRSPSKTSSEEGYALSVMGLEGHGVFWLPTKEQNNQLGCLLHSSAQFEWNCHP